MAAINLLRRRMIEEMTARNPSSASYSCAVAHRLQPSLGRSPDRLEWRAG
jgi:hypothetical protein